MLCKHSVQRSLCAVLQLADSQPSSPEGIVSQYYLCPDVYVCRIDDSAVFLKLRTNQYVGVNADYMPALERFLFCSSSAGVESPAINSVLYDTLQTQMNDLVTSGLLTSAESAGKRAEPIALQARCALARTLYQTQCPRITARHVAAVAAAFLRSKLSIKFSRLTPLIHSLQRKPSRTVPLEEVAGLIHAFRRIRPWMYTAHNKCLLDSMVLTAFLLRHDVPASLFIGVRQKPFSAHAWVQLGDCVVDDTVENVIRFTPLLVA